MSRNCLRCNGEGTVFHQGFTSLEGHVYPDETEVCSSCKGSKVFEEPNYTAILKEIISSKGKNKGKLKASWSGNGHYSDHNLARAYYCWRIARFNGGADTTLPMTASLVLRNDPYKPELEKLADEVAKASFGTDMAAAYRWGRAFGIV